MDFRGLLNIFEDHIETTSKILKRAKSSSPMLFVERCINIPEFSTGEPRMPETWRRCGIEEVPRRPKSTTNIGEYNPDSYAVMGVSRKGLAKDDQAITNQRPKSSEIRGLNKEDLTTANVLKTLIGKSARFSRMEIDTPVFRDHFICKISDATPYMEFFAQREDGLQFLSTKKMDLYPRGFEDGWVNVSGRIYLNGEGTARNRFVSLFLDFDDKEIEVVPRPDLKIVFYIQNPSTKKLLRRAAKCCSDVKQAGIREMVSIEELKAFISEQDTVLIGAMLEKI